jgi:crotonobetainyl-CoA:carnitine CoA-transferase CaiB-like acyl-CoA transferase
VLEVAGGPAAAFAGLLLAELGHEVVRVSPAGFTRFPGAETAKLTESEWQYLNRRKQSLEFESEGDAWSGPWLTAARDADALIEDLGPGGLRGLGFDWEHLRTANPDLVLASISAFGLTGPKSDWEASELTIQAAGGPLHSTGWKGERPYKAGGFSAHHIAGVNAATAILAARYGITAGNTKGVHLDISMQEAYLHHWTRHIGEWTYTGTKMHRERKGFGHQGFRHTAMAADGWLYLLALYASWDEIALFLGLDEFVTPEWQDPEFRAEHWPELEQPYRERIASRSRYDWFADGSAAGYTFAPVHSTTDQLTNVQFAARRFLKQGEITGREVPVPGLPFTWQESEAANRAPTPGEHNEAFRGGNHG